GYACFSSTAFLPRSASFTTVVYKPSIFLVALDLPHQSEFFWLIVSRFHQHSITINSHAQHFCQNVIRDIGHLQFPGITVVCCMSEIFSIVSKKFTFLAFWGC